MISKQTSASATIWNEIHLHLQFRVNYVRGFYAAAIKYILPTSAWDDRFPSIHPSISANEIMATFIRGFNEQNRTRMITRSDPVDELMRLAAIGKMDPLKKMHHRKRRKKIECFRRRMIKCFRNYCKSPKPAQGMTVTTQTIRRCYFPEEPKVIRQVA
jgi:hypothetical protein